MPNLFIFKIDDIKNLQGKLNKYLSNIKDWMNANYFRLNIGKTQLKIFDPNNNNIELINKFKLNTMSML